MIRLILLLFAFAFISANCHAEIIKKDNISGCTLHSVISELYLESSEKEAQIAHNSIATLDELEKIGKKAINPKKTIGEQLSANDRIKFDEASNYIYTMNMVRVIESKYERDLIAIEMLTKIADEYYLFNKVPSKKNEEFYALLLSAWRDTMHNKIKIENYNNKQCTLDFALYTKEIQPLMEMTESSSKYISSWNEVNIIMQKYNMKNFSYEKLNNEDKKRMSELRKILLPLGKKHDYITDIINIRHFAKISKMIHDTALNDMLYSGGDARTVGNSIDNLIKKHQLNSEDQKMLSAWKLLDNKIPSQATLDLISVSNVFKKN